MPGRDGVLGSLERASANAFLIGGLLLAVDAVFVAANVVSGVEWYLFLGQAFVGAGWAVALLGILGLYPALSERSRWLSRAGAVFAAVGVVTFAVMTVSVLVYAAGIPAGEYDAIGMYFIPGVIVGSVLGFAAFSAASIRAEVHSRGFGVLLLVPALLVLANLLRFIAGYEAATITLAIVIADAVAMMAIGYLLRNGSPRATRRTTAESSV